MGRLSLSLSLTLSHSHALSRQVLRNQGVQASQWGDVAGVVAECATRVLKTVSPAPKPETRNPAEPPSTGGWGLFASLL